MGFPDGEASHRISVQIQFRNALCILDPDIREDGALVDAKEQLVRIDRILPLFQLFHLRPAADKPPFRSCHRFLDIVPFRKSRRTLVKGHRNRGAKVCLDLHRLLRTHEDPCSVDVTVEGDAFLLDVPKLCQGEHLKAAGIREDRPVPERHFVEAAKLCHELIAGPHMQMVGVAEHDLRVDVLQVKA